MKEKITDFLKFAIKSRRIKDVEEAFKEFPPEEEWHKGRIENVLREDNKKYKRYYVEG